MHTENVSNLALPEPLCTQQTDLIDWQQRNEPLRFKNLVYRWR